MNLDWRDSSEEFEAKRWGLNFLLQDEVIITQKTVKILPLHDIFSSRNLHMEVLEGVCCITFNILSEKTESRKKLCKSYLLWGWDMIGVPWCQQRSSISNTTNRPRWRGYYHRWESLSSSPSSWKLLPESQSLITNHNSSNGVAFNKAKETMHCNRWDLQTAMTLNIQIEKDWFVFVFGSRPSRY